MGRQHGSFLSDIYTSLQHFDAEHLSIVHELSGAMLRDARTRLNQPPPEDPYLRSFQFSCGHVDEFFIFSLDPFRLAQIDDTFRGEPCLSCLAWRLSHLLDYTVGWDPPKLQVDHLEQLSPAEVQRWLDVLALTEYLSDLPPEFRLAWQGLAVDILGVLEQADGEAWLKEPETPLHKRVLEAASLGDHIFEERYGRARPDGLGHRRALAKVLEFEETTVEEIQQELKSEAR